MALGGEYEGSVWPSPWRYRDERGLYIGSNRQVWLYWALPLEPLKWENASRQLEIGDSLSALMAEIGGLSRAPAAGIRQLARNREIHLLSVTWEEPSSPPDGTPPRLAEMQRELLTYPRPRRTLVLGVRLWPESADAIDGKVSRQVLSLLTKALAEDVPDRSKYRTDRDRIEEILTRHGARPMQRDEQARIESWYNSGRGPQATLVEESTFLRVPSGDDLQMSAVMRFGMIMASAPNYQWALYAGSHPDAPAVFSVRAELEPAASTRARARNSQRHILATIREESETGDLDRPEFTEAFQRVQEFEAYIASSPEPLLTRCSIVIGQRLTPSSGMFREQMREDLAVEAKPLEHRQLLALDETLPCSAKRVNPFLQDLSISMIAHAGFSGFSNIGDGSGYYVGAANPELSPVFIDPRGAAKANLPAGTLIAGDSGSGKSFLAQMLATQAAVAGDTVIFINPKGFDSLAPMARFVGGQVVRMSALEGRPGAFDPFRYAPPEIAAEIATNHIISVLAGPGGFSQEQQLELGSALKNAAQVGVRCVGEAFPFIRDGSITAQIRQQMESSSLFALGIALEPPPRFDAQSGMTLVEFDRALDLPDPAAPASSYTRRELVALAAIRLVTRASMEILSLSGGGMLVVDEAWTFLGYSEGLATLQRLGREGRSLGILPVFATQKVADVLSRDMESYLSRVFCLKLTDERDARAALELCGLKPTAERIAWLRTCGPAPASSDAPGRPASALHRDLLGRHCAVSIWPTPPSLYRAISTNPDDREET